MSDRGTMERPWKQTIAGRGIWESALKPRTGGEGGRREAQVRTGLGNAHRPGLQGGLRQRGAWGNEAPTSRSERASVGNSPPTVARAADLSRPPILQHRGRKHTVINRIMCHSASAYGIVPP
jgi:hypothetical protein